MEILALLLSAGGSAFLVAIFNGIKSLRSSKNESEEALLNRINADADRAHKEADAQRQRAIVSEQQVDTLRAQRDMALESVAILKRELIAHNIDIPEL